MTKISGTKEWAVANVNCLTGCSHGCLYCFGKAMARPAFAGWRPTPEWAKPRLKPEEVESQTATDARNGHVPEYA